MDKFKEKIKGWEKLGKVKDVTLKNQERNSIGKLRT
jgi:hypothetical protein